MMTSLNTVCETVIRVLLARSLVKIQIFVLRKGEFLVGVPLEFSIEGPVVDRGAQWIGTVEEKVLVVDPDIECEVSNQSKGHAVILIQSGGFWGLESEMFPPNYCAHIFCPICH